MVTRRLSSPRPRQARRVLAWERRRADALAAAAAVFAERGFGGAQMGEVARRAELSLATLYALFSSKEQLFEAVIAETGGAVSARVRAEVEAVPGARARLLHVVHSLLACFEENRDLFLIYSRATQGRPWEIRRSLGEAALAQFHEFQAWVIGLAEAAAAEGELEGLDPEALALALLGAVTLAATRAAEASPPRPFSASAPPIRAVFERALRREVR
jgi:AcrR family transcriptional regulator